jgi:hypothetical protein
VNCRLDDIDKSDAIKFFARLETRSSTPALNDSTRMSPSIPKEKQRIKKKLNSLEERKVC